MSKNGKLPDILAGKKTMAPYPMDRVPHVDEITTTVGNEVNV